VRLSAFSIVDGPGSQDPRRDRYGEVLALADACESSGLEGIWLAEHHFHGGGLCPSPPILLTAIAARTQKLRLGTLVSVLPFHPPVELAEQLAMLDRLSGGRLNLGVGSGFLAQEFEGFGVAPETKRELFDRNLTTLRSALRGEEVRVAGPGGVPVRINVRPIQQPEPPLCVAVQRREAIQHLAAQGLSIALIPYATVARPEELADQIREYRSRLPPGRTGRVAVALHLYAGPEEDSARAALQRYLDGRLQIHSTHYAHRVERDPRAATAEGIESSGLALLGSPEKVAERLRAFAAMGVDDLLGIFDFGALPPAQVAASVRALAGAWVPAGGATRPGPG
jgi:alkanesulfonate monooxygenase SsuD/methylene tetrahydromethanopterin reductase-like flavin-dependent oxidoreductase (luciferase family)